MAKVVTPSFVLTMELDLKKINKSEQIIKIVTSESDINRQLYNSCLGELLKREKQMKRTKLYKKLVGQISGISKQISFYEVKVTKNESDADYKAKLKYFQKEKDRVMKQIFDMQTEYGLFEYSMHEYIKPMRAHFGNKVNVNVAQKTATRAWNTFRNKLKGEAKKVCFVSKGEFLSFEGKNNTTGWRYGNRKIVYKNYRIPLSVKENDNYMQEVLSSIENKDTFTFVNGKGEKVTSNYNVKYVRIIRKIIRGKERYFAQLICQGYPPIKKDKEGKVKYPIGKGRVGGDIGTSTMAFSSKNKVSLFNLGEQIKQIDNVQRKIRLLQRKLERSRRSMNPQHFDEQGRINKGRKKWAYSKRYQKNKNNLQELHRKLALYRKLSHQYMANRIKTFGHEFYVEKMNIRGLQKRAKETKISEKTGKFQKKKRFGKSIANRAPSSFISILKQKVSSNDGSFDEVNTISFKASQYDHKSDICEKKRLKERWHKFQDGTKVQRDLYAAFLLQNSNKNKKTTNQKLCEKAYEKFKKMHDKEIERIETLDDVILNSGIKLKTKNRAPVA